MSRRVDWLLASYEAVNRGDAKSAAAGLPARFELIPPAIVPEGDVHRGSEGVERFWRTWTTAFVNFRVEIEEVIEAGDQVIVMAALSGTGADSGVEVRTPSFAQVWSFEADTPTRMEAMPNRATALEAVGLSD